MENTSKNIEVIQNINLAISNLKKLIDKLSGERLLDDFNLFYSIIDEIDTDISNLRSISIRVNEINQFAKKLIAKPKQR
jgi:hypothetical protein